MSARKPAGAPEDWSERPPAGAPVERQEAGDRQRAATQPAADESASADEVQHDLDALLADVKRERDEYLELAQRARADFENYRKRAVREGEEAERRARADIARRLVPALDNLERALRSAGIDPEAPRRETAGEQEGQELTAHEALARGVALVYGELLATLEQAGVERYDPAGEPFDPAWHEALSTRVEDGTEPGRVLETVEKGYRLDGRVIRAARVVVSE